MTYQATQCSSSPMGLSGHPLCFWKFSTNAPPDPIRPIHSTTAFLQRGDKTSHHQSNIKTSYWWDIPSYTCSSSPMDMSGAHNTDVLPVQLQGITLQNIIAINNSCFPFWCNWRCPAFSSPQFRIRHTSCWLWVCACRGGGGQQWQLSHPNDNWLQTQKEINGNRRSTHTKKEKRSHLARATPSCTNELKAGISIGSCVP